MKHPLIVLLVLFLLSIQYCFAQGNKTRGFIVLNNNDTLSGWIEIPSQRSPEKITFYKDSMAVTAVHYTIADLPYFEIPGYNAYIRATIPIGLNNSAVADTVTNQTIWLRIVIAGSRLSLFEWKNERSRYYVLEMGGDYKELQIKTTNDQGYERELPLYKNLLTSFAIKYDLDNQALSRSIDNARYDNDDLTKIVIELNGNKPIVQYKRIREKIKWLAFVNAGAAVSALKLSGDKTYVGNLTFDRSVSPYFSLGAELTNFGVNKLALRLEISYTSAKYNGNGPSYSSSNSLVTYKLEQSTITPSLSVLYSFVRMKYFSLYGCVGIVYNFSSYKENVWRQTFPELTLTDFADCKKKFIAASVKMGIRIMQKFELGAGRQLFDDFIYQSSKYSFEHPTYNIWLGYRFNQ